MKKVFACMLALLLIVMMYACDGNMDDRFPADNSPGRQEESSISFPDESSDTPPFEAAIVLGLIQNGDYAKTIEFYNQTISGNLIRERETEDAVAAFCIQLADGLLAGEFDIKEVETSLTTLGLVLGGTELVVPQYTETKEAVEAIVASKAAFASAEELAAAKNWAAAIRSYEKVMDGDVNKADAEAGISQCMACRKEEVLPAAASLAEAGEWPEAIAELERLKDFMPNDSEILSKITIYKATHIQTALKKAEAAFVTPATDCVKALDPILQALYYYRDDEMLNEKHAYYQSFTPVQLYDLKPYKGDLEKKSNMADNFGTQYSEILCSETWYGKLDSATYDIGRRFDTLTATVFGTSTSTVSQYYTITIWGDGVKRYENDQIADNGRPLEISVDITGISDLQIEIRRNGNMGGTIGLADALLQKTKK